MTFGAMPCVVLNQIKSIADQCPDDGGFAVFAARAWYRRFEPMARWEGLSNCLEERPIVTLDEAIPALGMKVSPNPATNRLQVVFDTEPMPESRFLMFDLTGKKVLDQPLNNSKSTFDITDLPPGLYLYGAKNRDNFTQKGKITIIR